MNGRKHYSECPVCSSREINPLLTARDHSVSGEEFVIWQCTHCGLRFTQDVPDEAAIIPYYKSPDYISHTDTDKGFINKTYKKVRKITLQQKARLIIDQTGVAKGSLLDVGSGTGAFLQVMKEKGWTVSGIEPDEDARKLAQSLYGFQLSAPETIDDFLPASMDAITLWHVLEHVHNLHAYLEQVKILLKEAGKLFIAVPNYQSVDAGIYGLHWAAYDVPRHLYHFSPKSMEVLVQQHGLKLVNKKPMWFDSFYISLLSSKYRNGSTKPVSAFINGVRSNLGALAKKDRCSSIIYIVSKA
jgi:2-polyprenyl-3-methyl-5-hydroxy-6-metoxy-1,4-benzoquinol methylase